MSSQESHHIVENPTLADLVLEHTEVSAAKCYQCGKCSAGCPVSEEMDYPPSVIMRMLQAGFPEYEEIILRSYTIWLCVTCEMCFARCPMEIDIPKIMDYLRERTINLKMANPRSKNIVAFHRAFLDSIHLTGRLYEVGMVVDYKTRTMNHLMQDMDIAPKMFMKGKLHLIPELIKERKKMNRIFKKTYGKKQGGEE